MLAHSGSSTALAGAVPLRPGLVSSVVMVNEPLCLLSTRTSSPTGRTVLLMVTGASSTPRQGNTVRSRHGAGAWTGAWLRTGPGLPELTLLELRLGLEMEPGLLELPLPEPEPLPMELALALELSFSLIFWLRPSSGSLIVHRPWACSLTPACDPAVPFAAGPARRIPGSGEAVKARGTGRRVLAAVRTRRRSGPAERAGQRG